MAGLKTITITTALINKIDKDLQQSFIIDPISYLIVLFKEFLLGQLCLTFFVV